MLGLTMWVVSIAIAMLLLIVIICVVEYSILKCRLSLPTDWYLFPLHLINLRTQRRLQKITDELCKNTGVERHNLKIIFWSILMPSPAFSLTGTPTIFVKTWLVNKLSEEEIRYVIAHELAHRAYLYFLYENETVCDIFAVRATKNPKAAVIALRKMRYVYRQHSQVNSALNQRINAIKRLAASNHINT